MTCAKRLIVPLVLVAFSQVAFGEAAEFESRTFTARSGFHLKYRLFVPANYHPSKSYPLVMFLHGGQQRARGKWTAATVTGAMFCGDDRRQAKHPCFVFVPWASREYNWGSVFEGGPSPALLAAMEAIDSLEQEYSIDKRREYVTGLSGGGKGAWAAFLSHPGRFAAAIPLCARQAIDPESAALKKFAILVKDLPIWMWHGAKDPKNDPANSRLMYKALKEVGGNVRYTEVADAPHNCWDTAFASDELHDWLFQQRLPDSVSVDSQARARRRDAITALNPWTVEERALTRPRTPAARRN